MSPHPHQHLSLPVFFIVLVSAKWDLHFAFPWWGLMLNILLRALLAIHKSSLVISIFQPSAHFKIGLLSSCWAVWVVYTNWFRSFVGRMICRYFLPVRVLCLYLLTMSFEVQRFLILMLLNLSISYIVCALGVVSKNVCAIWGHEITLLLSSKCSFTLYIKVYDPFALVFVYDIQFCIW